MNNEIHNHKHPPQASVTFTILVLACLFALVAAWLSAMNTSVSDSTYLLWSLIYSLLIAIWAQDDAKAKKLYKPFEYSFLVLLLWPLILPYHLTKTRGQEGLLMYAGFLAIYFLPWFISLVILEYFSAPELW